MGYDWRGHGQSCGLLSGYIYRVIRMCWWNKAWKAHRGMSNIAAYFHLFSFLFNEHVVNRILPCFNIILTFSRL